MYHQYMEHLRSVLFPQRDFKSDQFAIKPQLKKTIEIFSDYL